MALPLQAVAVVVQELCREEVAWLHFDLMIEAIFADSRNIAMIAR